MSTTRHADPGAPISTERYMSSPEYNELRGIGGSAVAAKAELVAHPAKRGLLFFLQALSLAPGGLQKVSRDFLEMFADRIGTPSMHRLGNNKGKPYAPEITRQIIEELDPAEKADRLQRERLHKEANRSRYLMRLKRTLDDGGYVEPLASEKEPPPAPTATRTPAQFLEACRAAAERFPEFIIELCVNPALQFAAPDEANTESASATVPWFKDIVPALFEFKQRYEDAARSDFVMTEVGRKVLDVLDYGLSFPTGKAIVMAEGESGIGKTTATQHWCKLHLGEARFVSLTGITHKTGFFRAVAKALGLASSYTRTATEMQSRVEGMLQRSRLFLVVDEAQYLFGAAERVYTRPELVDWIDTALYNYHVPTALVCTAQFFIRAARAEKQTTWNAKQLRRRVKRICTLPAKVKTEDLKSVARKLLAGASKETIDYAVGYALSCETPLSSLVDSVDQARALARQAEREQITFEDIERGITDYCAPSADAWARVSDEANKPKSKRGRRPAPVAADPMDHAAAAPAPVARKTNLTGLAPVETYATNRRHTAPLVQRSSSAVADAA